MHPKIDELKKIRKIIDVLHYDEKIEIFKIIKKYKCNYTYNLNGVFINMTNLKDDVINDIKTLIEYSNDNKEIEKKRISQYKEFIN